MSRAPAGAATVAQRIARWRVTAGFACGAVVLWLAEPTWDLLAIGGGVAALGEGLRIWAAGHIEKSREVTCSGPYRITRHPLYLGSAAIALGLAIASGSFVVRALVIAYALTTIPAAIRAEESHLREKFGDAYDAYVQRRSAPVRRAWSVRRAIANREHQTIAGVVVAVALLAVKILM
jgi:protein-S-isoprenylcysteine O-methyltransferase Ste14